MLQGFKLYDLSIGPISLSVTSNGVAFSKTAVIRMEKCKYVTFYIDEIGQRVAIQRADEKDPGAAKFFDDSKKTVSVRWNNQDLLNTISKIMGWDLERDTYKIIGEFWPEENAIMFDLTKASCTSAGTR